MGRQAVTLDTFSVMTAALGFASLLDTRNITPRYDHYRQEQRRLLQQRCFLEQPSLSCYRLLKHLMMMLDIRFAGQNVSASPSEEHAAYLKRV